MLGYVLLSTGHRNEVNNTQQVNLFFTSMSIHCRISNALCLGGLVDYFSETQPKMSTSNGLMYAAGLFFSLAISAISWHPYMIFVHRIATHINIGLSGLIYRKVSLMLSTLYDYSFVFS